ncbi:MAG: DNA repair protein RecO [Gammaproteobacteria bacterium]
MTRETVSLQPAYVLHQRPYRDSSRLIDCLSRDHGRVSLVARGVQRPKSPLRSVLMPFQQIAVSWVRKTDLGSLTGAESAGAPMSLAPDVLMSGYYVNELLLRLVQSNEPQTEVFELYQRVLAELAVPDAGEIALRRFEKRLLEALGYGLSLSHEARSGSPIVADGRYSYRSELGACAADEFDEYALPGSVLLAIAEERFDDAQVLRAARVILRDALDEHLGSRPLRTRDVARALVSSKARGDARDPKTDKSG